MQKILFITTNLDKFNVAKNALKESSILLEQKLLDYEVPEVQSFSEAEIAKFSAEWVAERLNQSVIVSDTGYFIKALNGFPGPFIKYINKYLNADQILKLMDGIEDRSVEVRETLCYCTPNSEAITFTGSALGTISKLKGKSSSNPINEIFIPQGFNKVSSEIDSKSMQDFWSNSFNHWDKLVNYYHKTN